MAGPTQAASPQNLIAQNRQMRAALLASAPPMRKYLGNFNSNGVPGGTTRVKLFNVGITTRLILDVIATVDIGTAAATASPKAPFNLLNRVKLTDFDGADRVNCSGFQLFVLNSVRKRTPYGFNNGSLTATYTNPVLPTATGAGQQIRFQIEVPLAFAKDDLRGALLTQTAVGEAWLSIDWNSVLVSNGLDDAVYNGAATTTVVQSAGTSFNVNVFQEYLLPQGVGNQIPMPTLDLMTVYEVAGALRSSDNISVGAEKLINYPNVRSVIGFYANYLNNGVMQPLQAGLSKIRTIANGNNVLKEYLPTDKLFSMRSDDMIEGADLKPGALWELHRDYPIQTALYGNIQAGITPLLATASNNTNFEICFESFYTKGSTLPGLSQASG